MWLGWVRTRNTRMTRMGKGFVMAENLFRGHPAGTATADRNPFSFLSVKSVKSVVPPAVFSRVASCWPASPA